MKKITVWLATLVMCFGLVAATPQQADARRWHGGWAGHRPGSGADRRGSALWRSPSLLRRLLWLRLSAALLCVLLLPILRLLPAVSVQSRLLPAVSVQSLLRVSASLLSPALEGAVVSAEVVKTTMEIVRTQ